MKASTKIKKQRRHRKIRAKIIGTAERPRLSVSRSLNHIYAQIIDDEAGRTLVAVSDVPAKGKTKTSKTAKAEEVGKKIAQKALEAGFTNVVFDRGGRKYHGRVKALAESARNNGLKF